MTAARHRAIRPGFPGTRGRPARRSRCSPAMANAPMPDPPKCPAARLQPTHVSFDISSCTPAACADVNGGPTRHGLTVESRPPCANPSMLELRDLRLRRGAAVLIDKANLTIFRGDK